MKTRACIKHENRIIRSVETSHQKRKENVQMKHPCIAIDVSKESSHIQGFYGFDKEVSSPMEIPHNKLGFAKLSELIKIVFLETSKEVVVVYEDTGVYDKPLKMFLLDNNVRFVSINPLLSARYRKKNLRAVKTDKKDCSNIARVFYNEDLTPKLMESKYHSDLRTLNRYYEENIDHLRKYKVNFRESLDVVWPGFNSVFSRIFSQLPMMLIEHYGHPNKLKRIQKKTLVNFIKKNSCHRESWCDKKANEIFKYINSVQSGCTEDDILTLIMQDKVSTIRTSIEKIEKYLDEIIMMSKQDQNFILLTSIPGIGENLAARIIAEAGDISRFDNAKQLTAFAGLDPQVYESGSYKGKFSISKKGNKRLRSLLYLAASFSLREKTKPNSIRDYYLRKTQQGKIHKVALIACCNKLIRIIYSMCSTGTLYEY